MKVNSWSPSPIVNDCFHSFWERTCLGRSYDCSLLPRGRRGKESRYNHGLRVPPTFWLGVRLEGACYETPFQRRLRWVLLLIAKETDYAFPCGQPTIVAGGVVIAWLYFRNRYAIIMTVETSLDAFSRIYTGVRFPTDVFGVALLGAGFALIICSYPKLTDRSKRNSRAG